MDNVRIFAKTLEDEAFAQISSMAESDAYRGCQIRIMPDCHAGKGCTVGTVIRTDGKVVPNTVGVDIGCGMLVCGLGTTDIDLKELDRAINENIPYGFASHGKPVTEFDDIHRLRCAESVDTENALRQIGSLGGGNHFIELGEDKTGHKYLVIHSGSRHLGVSVCDHYQTLAAKKSDNRKAIVEETIRRLKSEGRERDIEAEIRKIPRNETDKDLAYLEGEQLDDYLHDMEIVQKYASLNRHKMADIILDKLGIEGEGRFETIHNYVDTESGIIRKGAVSARKGETLIIPINMRDGSLMCVGKGNPEWLESAPHGAGRILSRNKAKSTLSMDEFRKSMEDVYSTSVCESTLDEAPMAYKPIGEIVECIQPTVTIQSVIKPLYNFKAK